VGQNACQRAYTKTWLDRLLSLFFFTPLAHPASQPPSPRRNIECDQSGPHRYHPKSNHRQKPENPQNQKYYTEHRSETPRQAFSTPIRRPTQDVNEIRFELAKQSIHRQRRKSLRLHLNWMISLIQIFWGCFCAWTASRSAASNCEETTTIEYLFPRVY
jgi:hypothetical protein